MSTIILNGKFDQKKINKDDIIRDYAFSPTYDNINTEYISEHFPNWKFTRNNRATKIYLSNGNSVFGTGLPQSYSGSSDQCLIVQHSYYIDDQNNPPSLTIRNQFQIKSGIYSLSFSARLRGSERKVFPLTVNIMNTSSSPLNTQTIDNLDGNWVKKSYNFTVTNDGNYDLLLKTTNVNKYPDVSMFLTDFEISFVDFLPTTPPTTTPLPTTTLAPTNCSQLPDFIHLFANSVRSIQGFSSYADAYSNSTITQSNRNAISDYYTFRRK